MTIEEMASKVLDFYRDILRLSEPEIVSPVFLPACSFQDDQVLPNHISHAESEMWAWRLVPPSQEDLPLGSRHVHARHRGWQFVLLERRLANGNPFCVLGAKNKKRPRGSTRR